MMIFGIVFFALCTTAFFAAWVYQDCKKRGDDPVLWTVVVGAVSPFIGLLIYFLRRAEIKTVCPSCGHRISVTANYCENCGTQMEKEDSAIMVKQGTHHLPFIYAGILSMALMFACLIGFIASAVLGNGINTDVTSGGTVWNKGVIMDHGSYRKGVWKLHINSASEGFVKQKNMTISDADTQMLYADISCGTVPDGATLVLWLVQEDTVESVDVTNLSEPLTYPLDAFENGKVHVRLQINGVEDVDAEISMQ